MNDIEQATVLSELQNLLIEFLKSLGISLEIILPVMLYLEAEEEQAEFAMWLLNKWEQGITEGQIVDKVSDILNAHSEE